MTNELLAEIKILKEENEKLMRDYTDCHNELCHRCGRGNCEGCRWEE